MYKKHPLLRPWQHHSVLHMSAPSPWGTRRIVAGLDLLWAQSFSQGVKLLPVIRTIDQVLTEELRYLGRQGKEFLFRRNEKRLTIPAWGIINRRWLICYLGADILFLLFQTKSVHADCPFVRIQHSLSWRLMIDKWASIRPSPSSIACVT